MWQHADDSYWPMNLRNTKGYSDRCQPHFGCLIRLEDLLILASQYLQCDICGLNRLNLQICAAWISNLRVLQYHFDLAKFPWFVRALNTQQFAARIHMLLSNHINHGDSQFLVEWSHHAASMPLSPCDSSLIELIFLLAKELRNPHYCWL